MPDPHDPTSLDNLYDIIEPASVSLWWPLAPGWWIVIGLLLIILLSLAIRGIRNYQKNAFRRVALRELETLQSPHALPALLKRVALAVYPREQVAGLSADRWIAFLNQEVPKSFDKTTASILTTLDYGKPKLNEEQHSNLIHAVRYWVKKHK